MSDLTECVKFRLEKSRKGTTAVYVRIYRKLVWANLQIDSLECSLWNNEDKWPVFEDSTAGIRAKMLATRSIAAQLLTEYLKDNNQDRESFKKRLSSKIDTWDQTYGSKKKETPKKQSIVDPLETAVAETLHKDTEPATDTVSEISETKIQSLIQDYIDVQKPHLSDCRRSHFRTLKKYLTDYEVFLQNADEKAEAKDEARPAPNPVKKYGCRIDLLDARFHSNLIFFFRLPEERGGKGLGNSTIAWYLAMLKTVIRFYKKKIQYQEICPDCLFMDVPKFKNQHFYTTYDKLLAFAKTDFKKIVLGEGPSKDQTIDEEQVCKLLAFKKSTLQDYISKKGLPVLRTENKHTPDSKRFFSTKQVWDWYVNYQMKTQKGSLIRSMEIARDLFCFASFAPGRHSDAMKWTKFNLLKTNLKDGTEVDALRFTANKNGKMVTLVLNSYCMGIIEKYKDHPRCTEKLLPFPSTNQVLNKDLKKALLASGLFNDLVQYYTFHSDAGPEIHLRPEFLALTFHSARHNYATNMLAKGVNREYVKEAMSHKTIKTLEIYTHIISEEYTTATYVALEAAEPEFDKLAIDMQLAEEMEFNESGTDNPQLSEQIYDEEETKLKQAS